MLSRRQYLAGGAVVLAGCTGGDDDPGTAPGVTGSWTHLHAGTAAGTRATGTEPLEEAPAEAWSVTLGESGQFLLDDDVLYTVTSRAFSRRSLEDGSEVWNRQFDEYVRAGPAVGDRLYATTGHDEPVEHAFAVPDGGEPTEEWTREGVRGRRADEDLLVATVNDNSRLYAIDPDGSERWTITAEEVAEEAVDGFGPVVLGDETVFVVAERFPSTGWVAGLDRETGRITWTAQDPNQNTVLAATDDVVVSAGNEDGATGFSPTGDELWRVETGGRVESAAIVDDRVVVSLRSGSVVAYTTRGDEMWRLSDAEVASVDSGTAYDVADGVRAIGVEDGDTRWELDVDAELAVPADGGLFTLASDDPRESRLALFR